MASGKSWPSTFSEAWLLVRVVGLVALLRVLLPRIQLIRLLSCLTPKRVPSITRHALLEKAVYYTDALLWRFHFPLPGNCLPRSLILYYFATRLGFAVQFCCGVQRNGETLRGHAWLTRQGEAFLENGNPEKQFVVTFSFPN